MEISKMKELEEKYLRMLYPELKTKGKEYFKELGLVDDYVLISNQELIMDHIEEIDEEFNAQIQPDSKSEKMTDQEMITEIIMHHRQEDFFEILRSEDASLTEEERDVVLPISDMDKLHRYFVEATLKRYPNNYDEREVLLEAMERLKLEKTKEQETPEVADSDER